ncbi:MAG: tetratricopeptide repeat protein [Pseudomonadales bacterium]|nr:tetratricopeptide repeat protein [Pseudomonadales bacterium]
MNKFNVTYRQLCLTSMAGLVCMLSLLSSPGMAAENTASSAETNTATTELLPDSQLAEQQEYFQQQIQQLESQSGPFEPGLIEVLSDMGRWYQDQGQHEQAIEVYSRALHILRVNEGLYAEAQLRILDSLIFNYKAVQNWRLADDRHHLRFRLARKLYIPGTTKYLDAVATQGNWRLQVNGGNLLERSIGQQIEEARNLQQLYQQSIGELSAEVDTEADKTDRSLVLLPIAHGQAIAAYQQSNLLLEMPTSYFQGDGQRYRLRTVCYPVAGPSADSGSGGGAAVQLAEGRDNLSNVASGGQVSRVCSSERINNPAYMNSRNNERQLQLERAALSMQAAIQQLQLLVQTLDPQQNHEARRYYASQLSELEVGYIRLQRDIRRNSLRWSQIGIR